MKNSTWRAKYGRPHRTRRRAWASRIAAGGVRCARGPECVFAELVHGRYVGGLIRAGQPFDLGHDDDVPGRYAGPEHRTCNRRTMAHRAAREQPHTSRAW